MIMKYFMIVVFLVIAVPAHAFDKWDKTEIGMEIAYIGLHIVDWGQTLNIARDDSLHEHNPALGRHPKTSQVNAMFAAGLILQPIIAHVLPHNWRKAWIGSGIILEAGCVGNNIHCGIRASF